MPNAPAQQGKLPATLLLDNAVRLTGQLSSLLDGRWQLDDVQGQDAATSASTATLEPGSPGTLSLLATGSEQRLLEAARVTVCSAHRDSLTLEFAPANRELATRYRSAIGGGGAPGFGQADRAGGATASPGSAGYDAGTRDAANPAPAPRAPAMAITADYALLLENLQQEGLEDLGAALAPFFSDLTGYLLELASRIKTRDDGDSPHYHAATILRRSHARVTERLLQQLRDFFQDLTPEHNDDHLWQYTVGSSEELGLIDLEEFEDFLAIERMVTLGEDLHKLALEALTLRLAALVDVDPNRVRLPIHVRQICRAFQAALREENIPQAVLAHIFDYFAKHFVRQLDGYYGPLNELLSEHGVLPRIEIEIRNKGTLLKRNQPLPRPGPKIRRTPPAGGQGAAIEPLTSAIQELTQFHRQLGDQLGGILGTGRPASLYRSVVDALNFKREAEGLADGQALAAGTAVSGTWSGATVASSELDQSRLADAQSIARALSALQRDSTVRDAVQQSESLRAYLANNRDHIGGLQNTSGLTADSLNQLDMVDNLFGTIKSQLDVSADLKPALGNLQIPLAKLALLDPRFFVDHSHTARAVVDRLSRLAASANFPNKALEGRINNIVDEIVADYESDDSVFETALAKIDKLAAQQERALSRNIERVVRTQEGRQRLAQARRAVGKVVSARLQPPAAPKVLLDLIDSGWRDLLVLTHVRNGADSPVWAEQIKTLDQLCLWLQERQQGEVDDDLSVQRSMEAEPFIDLIAQQISSALPTNIAH
ncbi:MAG: DUF1631 family protein, partial [Halioglobus sp.]